MENSIETTNASHEGNLYQHNYSSKFNYIAWGAIIIGLIVSLGYQILLNLLGIGLGLSSFNLDSERMFNIGVGAIIWLAVSGIISMGIGGWFMGVFSNVACGFERGCLAVVTWSLATLLMVFIATSASGALLGGVVSIAKNSIGIVSQNSSLLNSQQVAPSESQQEVSDEDITNAKEKANVATDNLGKASLILFFAFLLSGIASVLGAVFGGKSVSKKHGAVC